MNSQGCQQGTKPAYICPIYAYVNLTLELTSNMDSGPSIKLGQVYETIPWFCSNTKCRSPQSCQSTKHLTMIRERIGSPRDTGFIISQLPRSLKLPEFLGQCIVTIWGYNQASKRVGGEVNKATSDLQIQAQNVRLGETKLAKRKLHGNRSRPHKRPTSSKYKFSP